MKNILDQINYILDIKLDEFKKSNQNALFNAILDYCFKDHSGKKLRSIIASIFALNYFNIKNISIISDFLIAIELIHLYSLVHDDLPALDNDDFRRSKPTIHKKFSEFEAILFGDGLQALAFNFCSKKENLINFKPHNILKLINFFSETIGPSKLIYGQSLDLNISKNTNFISNKENNQSELNLDIIHKIHKNKTAVFFGFSACLGGILIEDDIDNLENKALRESRNKTEKAYEFGKIFGINFQIIDDIDDFHEKKKSELNILNFIDHKNLQEILKNNIKFLKSFIVEEINEEKRKIFYEVIDIFNKYIYNI
jgi:geranylgeranyl diphosphate synthase type II